MLKIILGIIIVVVIIAVVTIIIIKRRAELARLNAEAKQIEKTIESSLNSFKEIEPFVSWITGNSEREIENVFTSDVRNNQKTMLRIDAFAYVADFVKEDGCLDKSCNFLTLFIGHDTKDSKKIEELFNELASILETKDKLLNAWKNRIIDNAELAMSLRAGLVKFIKGLQPWLTKGEELIKHHRHEKLLTIIKQRQTAFDLLDEYNNILINIIKLSK